MAEKAGVRLQFVRELEQGKETLRLDKVNQVLQPQYKTKNIIVTIHNKKDHKALYISNKLTHQLLLFNRTHLSSINLQRRIFNNEVLCFTY